jgi:hypothetical protein
MKTYKSERALPLAVIGLMFAFVAGCAAHRAYLVPAPTDNLANGGHSAVAESNGVKVVVTPNQWNGTPRDLPNKVTPVKVRIVNHSNQPLRVVYGDFTLQTQQGTSLAALPPSEIRGTQYISQNIMPGQARLVEAAWRDEDSGDDEGRVLISPGFDSDNFYYAPYWSYGYAGLSPWPYGWAPDQGYYNMYYPYMQQVHLPTQSMLRKGIPEGVIKPGGYVDGFLYFKKVDPSLNEVSFVAKLQDAKTGRQFGTISVPLEVKSK